MPTRYSSFLLRWWRLTGGGQRVEIEHIQSGERTLLGSLPAALDWIGAHSGDTAIERPAASHPLGRASGGEAKGDSFERRSHDELAPE